MDGLLLDTETFYTIAQQEICKQHGREFTFELKAKMMGQKSIEAARIFINELDIADSLTPEQFLEQREAILDELFPTAQLMPGAHRLIRHLHAHRVPIAVATSSHHRHFELKTSQHQELFSLFDHIITGDMVSRGKPDPQIFDAAMQAWTKKNDNPHPSRCLVFEDAPSGVTAAKKAGMLCVMVPDPRLAAEHREDADEVLVTLLDFCPENYGLPPFRD